MSIKHWDNSLKPREKALVNGFESLSDSEVLAIILKSGYKGLSSVELANQLLIKKGGLVGLMKMSLEELMDIKGIKLAKATQLLAYIELSKRMEYSKCTKSSYINNPYSVVKWLNSLIGISNQECFVVIFLNEQNMIIGYKLMSLGTINSVSINIREVFQEALLKKSNKIVLAHNHPSGNSKPSNNDIDRTNEFVQASKLIGVEVLDHLIITGDSEYFSFKEYGMI